MKIKESIAKPERINAKDGTYFKFANGDYVGPFAYSDYYWSCGYMRVQKETRGAYQFLNIEGELSSEYQFAAAYLEGKADVRVNGEQFARDVYGNLWERETLEKAEVFRSELCEYIDGKKKVADLNDCVFKYPHAEEYFKMIENHKLSVFVCEAQDEGMDENLLSQSVKERQELISKVLNEKFNKASESNKKLGD